MRLERETEFWEIERDDRSATIRTGRIGTRGKTQRLTAESADELQRAYEDAIIDAIIARGFREQPAAGWSPKELAIRDAGLEQILRERRTDRDAYLVYADWLQAAGNPAGELIAAEVRRDLGKDPKIDKRLDALRGQLRMPLPDKVRVLWRWGTWRSLRLENARALRGGTSGGSLTQLAHELFKHVLCCALDELLVGYLGTSDNYRFVPDILNEAKPHAWARELPRLVIGGPGVEPYAFAYDAGAIGPLVSEVFPKLRTLRLTCDVADVASRVEGFALPELRDFAAVGFLGRERLARILRLPLPKLERLELWLGPVNAGLDPRALEMLFDCVAHPGVRHLALRNSEYAADYITAILTSPIGKRLRTLDLSKSTLDDDTIGDLVDNPEELPLLQRLVLDENFLSASAVRRLALVYGDRLSAKDQRARNLPRTVVFPYPPRPPRRRR